MCADEEVARYIGGGSLDAAATANQVVHLESLPQWPPWDEVEIGWVTARHAQGRDYAEEAAST